jgi:hypothetical protein
VLISNLSLTEQEVRAFVGPKADYYLKQWRPVLEGKGNVRSATGFNWTALLLSGLWIPYRKMYPVAAIFFVVSLGAGIVEDIICGFLGRPEAPVLLARLEGLVASTVCGRFGNAWYLSHTQKTIAKLRGLGLQEDAYFQVLARRGGASIAAVLGFWLLAICASALIFLLTELALHGPL